MIYIVLPVTTATDIAMVARFPHRRIGYRYSNIAFMQQKCPPLREFN